MERKLTWLLIISVIVIFLSLAGFFPSYIAHFPDYGNFKDDSHSFCGILLLVFTHPDPAHSDSEKEI